MIQVIPVKDNDKRSYFVLKQDNVLLDEVNVYLKHLAITHHSPNSVRAAAYSLSYYYQYLETQHCTLKDVANKSLYELEEHIALYMDWIRSAGRHVSGRLAANRSCNIYTFDLIRFFVFQRDMGMPFHIGAYGSVSRTFTNSYGVVKHKNILLRNHKLKEVPYVPKQLTHDEINTLIGACRTSRDKLIICMLVDTGFRIGELLGLHLCDVDTETGSVDVAYREGNVNHTRAKYAEERKSYLSPATRRLLLTYLQETAPYHSPYLYVKLSGKNPGSPMTVSDLYAMFSRLEARTGIHCHPHQFRHYFANEMRDAGIPLEDIQLHLGHKKFDTTLKYLGKDEKKLNQSLIEYQQRLDYADLSDYL